MNHALLCCLSFSHVLENDQGQGDVHQRKDYILCTFLQDCSQSSTSQEQRSNYLMLEGFFNFSSETHAHLLTNSDMLRSVLDKNQSFG